MTGNKLWTRFAIYGVLIALCAFYLMPFYVMIITGLKEYQNLNVTRMWELPIPPTLTGFIEGWRAVAPNFINSVRITVPAAIISAFIGSINGYIFAKWRFPRSDLIFTLFLFGMFLPYQGILIPMVKTLQLFHLYGTTAGLILVHCI